jgi:hypothetical protein
MNQPLNPLPGHTRISSRGDNIECEDCGATGVCSGETLIWFLNNEQIYRCPAKVSGQAPSKPYKRWLHARLLDPELACSYLRAHLVPEDGPIDRDLLALALQDIADAHGID